jgi:hypothetical protein
LRLPKTENQAQLRLYPVTKYKLAEDFLDGKVGTGYRNWTDDQMLSPYHLLQAPQTL